MAKLDRDRQFDLDRLYAAVDDETAFATLTDAIAGEVGGRSAMFLHVDGRDGTPMFHANYWPADKTARYFAEFTEADPWTALHRRCGVEGRAMFADERMPPAVFQSTTLYNELIRPLGDDTARCVGFVINRPGLRFQVGVHRAAGADAFDMRDERRLDALKPHLDRIFALRGLVAAERAARLDIEAMLGASDRAMLCVDRTLRVMHASAAALALLDRGDGLGHRDGRLTGDGAAMTLLKTMVRATAAGTAGERRALAMPRRSGAAPYRIAVLPARPAAPGRALLVIDDPATRDPDRIVLAAQLYGLTPAESDLARGLLADETLEGIAARRRVSRETVRTQLRTLFARTGTSRQTALVRLLAGLPGVGGA